MKTATPCILITGFEPFGANPVNPSAAIAQALDGRCLAGHRVVGVVLPCVFGRAQRELARWRRRYRPVVTICLGLAEGRQEITPERVAINLDDARIPDNAGAQPGERPVVRGGPAAYWSTLPVAAMVAALRAQGVPAAPSTTAGTFVCNHVFYGLMHALARPRLRRRRRGERAPRGSAPRGGFIHVPPAREETKRGRKQKGAGLPLGVMIAAIETAARVCLRR